MIKKEQKITNLELSKKIKEAGIGLVTEKCWLVYSEDHSDPASVKTVELRFTSSIIHAMLPFTYPAYDPSELGEILPRQIKEKTEDHPFEAELRIYKTKEKPWRWVAGYFDSQSDNMWNKYVDENLADCMGQNLLWLIKEKYEVEYLKT